MLDQAISQNTGSEEVKLTFGISTTKKEEKS